jgi:hypothetical protein
MRHLLAGLLLIAGLTPGWAAEPATGKKPADADAARTFQQQKPCPSTGQKAGECPGYVRDYIVPLACGGRAAAPNMQWQTVEQAQAKSRAEVNCRKGALTETVVGGVTVMRGH